MKFIIILKVNIGSWEHLLPIALAMIFSTFIIKYAFSLNEKSQYFLIHKIALGISLTVISFHLYKLFGGNYHLSKDLPLYLCSLLGILVPVFTYLKKYWMFEILLFWIIAGTLQAVITPDIKGAFLSFDYLRYWIVHLGLLFVIFYYIIVFKWRPELRSVFKSFLALQVYVIFIILVNVVLSSNYFYLNEKPQSASLLDYFGPWPWYIIVAQLIIIPYFLLVYSPFYFINRNNKNKLMGK